MKYNYRIYYGGTTSKKEFVTWKDACHFIKHLLDIGFRITSVEKI